MDLLRRLIEELPEESVWPDPQGMCIWCDGGWEWVPGPRGGKAKHTYTQQHKEGCPYAEAREALNDL